MMNISSVLDDYRNGDFDQRLTLFLNYRDIRQEFIEIDEADLNGENPHPEAVSEEAGC